MACIPNRVQRARDDAVDVTFGKNTLLPSAAPT